MYWLEWMLWYIQTSPRENEQWQDKLEKILAVERAGKGKDKRPGIYDRVSDSPSADGSVHELNGTYIELQAGESQERRGAITFMTLAIVYFLYDLSSFALMFNEVWFSGVYYSSRRPAETGDYVTGVILIAFVACLFWVVLRYARIFINLENFVQRRMLIRFNRVTRQVYLHRPKFAGGITVFDWEQVSAEAVVGEDEGANIGRKLILSWGPTMPDLPHFHIVFVGKRADGTSDITNLWEFIRRYMEEGPQSVPVPKKFLSKAPWPWLSVMATLSFFRPLWRAGLRWQVACIVALASPALALHTMGHWISLLLCWEPRWPRIIREAGLPGKPVPPLSTAADWPPLPKVESAKKKRRAHKPAQLVGQDPNVPESTSAPESATHRQGLE
ncbi:DUF6708 domain-containing protein [Pseudomonas sp. zfem002]|uniref:DUF6708 domain-containing protein n=1 Tax=Pseudomonas sp. zfem002 TaxID=3078197 RepID=UPI0029291A21|nr:DUF6708 domain-containing protein [Pseudomonas sp. zfem002]MDU9390232.1 hypothetical protein [Pseudomonas sp. zfem002]